MYLAAVFSNGQVATGNHHGDAYAHLNDEARNADDLLVSGHVNADGSFTTELQHPKKTIIIIRHAESEHNAGSSDSLDSNLTTKGLAQGMQTAKFIRQMNLSGFRGYCSPLLRCLSTATLIHETTGIPFQVSSDLSEVTLDFPHCGIDVPCHFDNYQHFQWQGLSDKKHLHFSKEAPSLFLKRLSLFMQQLADYAIIVTHGTCVMTLVELALGAKIERIAEWDGSIPNASVSYVTDGTLRYMGKTIC